MAKAKTEEHRPVTVLIAAMGGEGGGVLTSWLVSAARKANLPVQATSIPGVAQRTGATTYYIEIVPTPYDKLGGKEPVMDLYPGPGDIDILVSTELVETGRMLERGFVSPERTTLIGSTHRVYTMAEKMAMSDQRFDGEKIKAAAKNMAKREIMFDIERAAKDAGSIMNAVILGAMAAADILPIPAEAFEEGIKAEGKAVKSNLSGFAAGMAYAKGEVVELKPKRAERKAPGRKEKRAEEFKARIERDYPEAVHPVVMEACGRVLDYQDSKYARQYLDRLDGILAIEKDDKARDWRLTNEAARHLGLRMTFEDVIRVAQLKTRRSRFERVRDEVQAEDDQLVRVTEFLKPGIEEFSSLMPPFMARPLLRWAEKKPGRKEKTHIGMYVRSTNVWGFFKMRTMAGMRRIRRIGYRYKIEQELIDEWLDLVKQAATVDRALALEVVELARLIKGYGSTHARGVGNLRKIVEAVVEPAIKGKVAAADALSRAREAALADPEGETLGNTLAELAAPPQKGKAGKPQPAAAE